MAVGIIPNFKEKSTRKMANVLNILIELGMSDAVNLAGFNL
jgi:spore coat polysaccharide biosynthesis predicted glycosyltransferase SpsG